METGLIIVDEFIRNSRIEPSFIILLQNEGLIDVTVIEGEQYISESQLTDLEKFANLYYELSINIEGIDAIHNLLIKMKDMEQELFHLRKIMQYHRSIWDSRIEE